MHKKTSICDLLIKREMGDFTKNDFDKLREIASCLADTQVVVNQHIKVSLPSMGILFGQQNKSLNMYTDFRM